MRLMPVRASIIVQEKLSYSVSENLSLKKKKKKQGQQDGLAGKVTGC